MTLAKMPFEITEWFGYHYGVQSEVAKQTRADALCPFIDAPCSKKFNDASVSGVCSVLTNTEPKPVIICPNRLYADNYAVLGQVAEVAFGTGHQVIHPDQFRGRRHTGNEVVAFGKHFGKELRLPSRGGRGNYFVDWILASISSDGELADFIAVEVQAIDTTGSYRPEVIELRNGATTLASSKAGLNWENVNKRILPQLIYKGHVLRREPLCTKGLFFICPTAVYRRVIARLGDNLLPYANLQPGSITFLWYDPLTEDPGMPSVIQEGTFSTTVDQVALAFTAPANLPPQGVYEDAIRAALNQL